MTDPQLADLGDAEVEAIGRELAAMSTQLPYTRAANWAGRWALRFANELERRAGTDPDPLPAIVTLSDLGPRELRRLADRVHVLAALESADGEDGPAARWWRALHARIVAAIERRERDAEPLREWMSAHPINRDVPTGTPTWREVSGEDAGLAP
jgi:hypothetical protein